ncbi:hypothetical protein [Daejeonella oryzae]|uniref:hypothetical protein n=1 Tax=Daejeonella oryzae TaxID=1122943 RepID=UPI0003FBB901|nr:hypothetical protein [Daejeonella oryzae]
MKHFIAILGIFLLCSTAARAQHSDDSSNRKQLAAFQDSLKSLSYKIINNSVEPERYNANYTFIRTLVSALKISRSYNFSFDSLKSVSVQNSPDSRFRIFSWNVMNNDGSYRFYGTVQMNNPDGKLEMFPLVDYSAGIKNPADTLTNNDKWYGAQYYKIIPVLNNVKTPYYILLGWKGNNIKSTKKVIDVLYFKDGKAHFGMPVFDGDKDRPAQKRVIFEYTRKASMFLNFNLNEAMIVFDHLAPPDPKLNGRYELYGPDFSYDGYKLVNGRWKFVTDLELKNPPTDKDNEFNDPKKMGTIAPINN